MRVITGTARGRRLETREGLEVRPTTDRVKEGLFSAIQFDIEGRRVLDLFAGSGQLGIEALSRGAASCVFIDSSSESVEIVKKNLIACELQKNAKVVCSDFESYLRFCHDTFDIVFLDPPYGRGLLEPALALVAGVMSDAGIILCEHSTDTVLPDEIGGFSPSRRYRYGKTGVTLLRKVRKEGDT